MDGITNLTYNVKLKMTRDDFNTLYNLLEQAKFAYNECASYLKENNIPLDIKSVHNAVYDWMRAKYALLPAQSIIRTYKEVLSAFRSIKSNKHEDADTPERKNLAMRLDKRLYANLNKDGISLTGFQKGSRKTFSFVMYDAVSRMFDKYLTSDPLIFIRNGEAFLSIPFQVPTLPLKGNKAVGIDMGMKRFAVTSDGIVFDDKKYKAKRRRIRHLKSILKAKGTKSAKRKLKRLKRKEANLSDDFIMRICGAIIKNTNADVFVVENLKGIKTKTSKHKNGFKRKRHNNALSQVAISKFQFVLGYKAQLVGKRVETVSPTYTSQTDCRTNKRDGKRLGCRYVCSDGVVFDADWNAAINIVKRSKHPVSNVLPIDGKLDFLTGRLSVNKPNAGKPASL